MRLRFHDLVGKRVVTADGECVGRIVDLAARAHGEELRVEQLFVGGRSWLHRVTLQGVRPGRVPWSAVARLADDVHLRLRRDELPERQDSA